MKSASANEDGSSSSEDSASSGSVSEDSHSSETDSEDSPSSDSDSEASGSSDDTEEASIKPKPAGMPASEASVAKAIVAADKGKKMEQKAKMKAKIEKNTHKVAKTAAKQVAKGMNKMKGKMQDKIDCARAQAAAAVQKSQIIAAKTAGQVAADKISAAKDALARSIAPCQSPIAPCQSPIAPLVVAQPACAQAAPLTSLISATPVVTTCAQPASKAQTHG